MSKNLMESLLDEITRVTEIKVIYEDLPNGAGVIAASLMDRDIREAKAVINAGDVVQMIRLHEKLKEYEL